MQVFTLELATTCRSTTLVAQFCWDLVCEARSWDDEKDPKEHDCHLPPAADTDCSRVP